MAVSAMLSWFAAVPSTSLVECDEMRMLARSKPGGAILWDSKIVVGICRGIGLFVLTALASQFAYCQSAEPHGGPKSVGLVSTLSSVSGDYLWDGKGRQYVYSMKAKLEEILSVQKQDTLLPILVDCLDDASLSQTRLEGKNVVVGLVCYEALSQTVYFEPTAPNGDVAKKWAGHIEPSATIDELRVAKGAWLKVLRDKTYRYL
jgi:hypothetical protein